MYICMKKKRINKQTNKQTGFKKKEGKEKQIGRDKCQMHPLYFQG